MIYYEIGGDATTASAPLEGNELTRAELCVSFLCVDTTGVHETGAAVIWTNRITLKYRIFQQGQNKMLELQSAPRAEIRYTSDGSDPKLRGGRYEVPFVLPTSAPLVLACAERDGVRAEVLRIPIDWERDEEVKVDPKLPTTLRRSQKTASTQESYAWLSTLKKSEGQAVCINITIGGSGGVREWLELNVSDDKTLSPPQIEEMLEVLRRVQADGQVILGAQALRFPTGEHLLNWVAATKSELRPGEVKQ